MAYSSRLYGEGVYGSGIYGLDLDNSTELTVQQSDVNGLDINFTAAAANGNYFNNTGAKGILVYAVNASGGDIDITIYSNIQCSHGSYHDYTITVTAGEERIIGFFELKKERTNRLDDKVYLWYESVTSLTVAAVDIDQV